MDQRLQKLSYSSLLTLHSCPRKFQLYRLNSRINESEDASSSVTFAYGTVVGLGIQEYITSYSESNTIWQMFLAWKPDLLDSNPKQNKSFWLAVSAVQRFINMCADGFMQDWKLAYYDGKPATELSFKITFPNGMYYVGFVDAVLQHTQTGEVRVLECKTTSSATVSAATYKNSFQAIGYSIVLDTLFPSLSSYEVQYLIYKTKAQDYDVMIFEKSYLDRALWIRTLLLDVDTIQMYESAQIYPMHGESCNDFYRECQYFGLCTLATEALTDPYDSTDSDKTEYQITLSVQDLIQSQLSKD